LPTCSLLLRCHQENFEFSSRHEATHRLLISSFLPRSVVAIAIAIAVVIAEMMLSVPPAVDHRPTLVQYTNPLFFFVFLLMFLI